MRILTMIVLAGGVLLAGTPALAAPPASKFVGSWSSVQVSKGDDPHASGLEIELWKSGGQYYGYIAEYVGPAADPPVGKLDGIRYDESTGALSFTTKLSVGTSPDPAGTAWLPSKNIYEFKGTVGNGALTGTLKRKYPDDSGAEPGYEEAVTLKSKGELAAESYDDWTKRWSEALKRRGPKW